MLRWFQKRWYVVTAEEFDAAFSQDATIADVSDESAENAYVERDTRLIQHIRDTCDQVVGPNANDHIHHLEDWWPNHTRYIYVSRRFCSNDLITSLRALLTHEFSTYRIQLVVSHNLAVNDDKEIGALAIYADRVVVESEVAEACGLTKACMTR